MSRERFRRHSGPRIPLSDAAGLARPLRRTRLVRIVLGIGLLACGAAAFALALDLREGRRGFLPAGSNGVIVVDMSASITPDSYRQVLNVLEDASRTGERWGLVLFSDNAYEALPPGTKGDALVPFTRFFRPLRRGQAAAEPNAVPVGDVTLPSNPWAEDFTAGTAISSGLVLARRILYRDRPENPGILLVSDLATAQSDQVNLREVLTGIVRDRIPLRIVGLSPAAPDKAFFDDILRRDVVDVAPAPSSGRGEPERISESELPRALALVCVLLLVGLTVNELWCGRLSWRGSPREKEATA
jgi:hypothetical protein